ncbi:MAG: rhodanese-like domain-containing protein [Candidatus Dadabacteria bacterium]|nr:MAG: rhodanese-like domain-containing protein [Candidatus Dadabacteria bacterium]
MKKTLQDLSVKLYRRASGAAASSAEEIIPAESAWELINNGAFLLDVRSEKEVAEGTLNGAVNIPHDQLSERLTEIPVEKDHPIVVFCAVGGRASIAQDLLKEAGFKHVHNAGGYKDLLKCRPAGV